MNEKEKAFYTDERSATWLSPYWGSVALVWGVHLLLKSVSKPQPLTSHQQTLFWLHWTLENALGEGQIVVDFNIPPLHGNGKVRWHLFLRKLFKIFWEHISQRYFFVKRHRSQFSKTMPSLKLIKATGKMLFHMYVCLYSPMYTNPVHTHIKDGVCKIFM